MGRGRYVALRYGEGGGVERKGNRGNKGNRGTEEGEGEEEEEGDGDGFRPHRRA